jgi:hypothetical protein
MTRKQTLFTNMNHGEARATLGLWERIARDCENEGRVAEMPYAHEMILAAQQRLKDLGGPH